MAPKIALVGGGSTHWSPTLLVDFANSKLLCDAEITLTDINPTSLPRMVELAEHIATCRGIGLRARAAPGLEEAVKGTDFVITTLSVGGFTSMACDIEIPYRYGIRQPVGDTVGPGGIFRSLRSVPVMREIAKVVTRVAPESVLVNVSNPLTALSRVVARETDLKVIGLCNELVGMEFVLSLLFDVGFDELRPTVGGLNHLPIITALTVAGEDGFEKLRDLLENPGSRADEPIWMDPPAAMHWHKDPSHEAWTKGDVIANCRLKFELFRRFGVLPGSADTHISEFFSWFLAADSDFGRDWGVFHYGMFGHRSDKERDDVAFEALRSSTEVPSWPSGELVAALLEGMVSGEERVLPMNLPNTGQVTNLPLGTTVECIGVSDADGVRPRDVTTIPGLLGHHVQRIAASQELTIDAALSGNRTTVLEAMLCDPIVGALSWEDVQSLTDEMFAATGEWLPAFSN